MRPSSAPTRPSRLGRYEVVAKIAGGGTASIYLARTPEGDSVALKTMRREAVLAGMGRALLDEAELLARVRHPNVVRVFEAGTDAGEPFLAMELVRGTTLAAVFKACEAARLVLDPYVIAYIGARIASALDHVHNLTDDRGTNLGIIHRDVNPANVFVTFDGEVKLFDFGMAKAAFRHVTTMPGIVKGKLAYLAPEQIMQLPIDGRCDLFALGTTLWELATTRRLFTRSTDAETVRAVHVGPIPDPRTLVPNLPGLFVEAILRSLQRKRDHRYGSGAAMARHLDAFVKTRGDVDLPNRLAQMQDHLFPGERRRQDGWLKPMISPSRSSIRPKPPGIPGAEAAYPPSGRLPADLDDCPDTERQGG